MRWTDFLRLFLRLFLSRFGVAICIFVTLVVGLVCGIPVLKRSAARAEYETLVKGPYQKIQSGDTRVLVLLKPDLLHVLASDAQSTSRVTEIHFSSIIFSAAEAECLARFENLQEVSFYCCKNVDAVLPPLESLPLTRVGFELSPFAPEQYTRLGGIESLSEIWLEQNISELDELAIKGLPSRVSVCTSSPHDAYP